MVALRLGVLLTVLLVGGHVWADIKIQDWLFDGDKPGNIPAGFAPGKTNGESGRWEVKADPKASSPPHVLARVGSDQSGQAAQVLFIEGAEAANLDMTARIMAVSNGDGQGGGVVFRAEDNRNYYVVWLSPQENLVRLERAVNGELTLLQDLTVNAEVGKWHFLRLSIRGSVFEAFFDNRKFLSAREDTWLHGSYKKGKIGLWARGTAATYFDNVRFTPMDEGTGSGPLGGTESTIIK